MTDPGDAGPEWDVRTELERRMLPAANLQALRSAGGMVPVATARQRPVVMAMSGPAAGVAASVQAVRALRPPRVPTFDMGGTTTDVCIITGGAAEMTDICMTGDRPLRQATLAVQSIGAGGGSVVRLDRPGSPATRVHMANTSNTPAELLEATYALRVERQSIRRGAGGNELHRGGDGVVRAYRVLAPRMLLTTCVERIRVLPYGLCSGLPGLPFRITLERDGAMSELPGKANLELRAGDLVTLESCCGGGYGPAGAA